MSSGKDNRLFPDLDDAGLEEAQERIAKVLEGAGIDPAFVYAYRKTGMMVTELNVDGWSKKDLKEWDAAIAEYEKAHPK